MGNGEWEIENGKLNFFFTKTGNGEREIERGN